MSEDHNAHAGQGPVLLDIGADVGALIVIAPVSLVGEEIEARRIDQPAPDHLPHAEVLGRRTPNGITHCAVLGELAEGDYELSRRPDGPVAMQVRVDGGRVREVRWPTAFLDPHA
jgi:hypothetical protein